MRERMLVLSLLSLAGCGVVTRTGDGAADRYRSDATADGAANLSDRALETRLGDGPPRTDRATEADSRGDVFRADLLAKGDLKSDARALDLFKADRGAAPDAGLPLPFVVGIASTTEAKAVALAGSYAYVADGSGGLVVIDVSSPTAPKACSAPVSTYQALDVAVAGNIAYVADGAGGLVLVDVTSPCSAKKVLPGIPSSASNAFRKVLVSGSLAFVLSTSSLVVVDVATPTSPQQLANQFLGTFLAAGAAQGSNLFVAGSEIVAVNVANPASPVKVGTPLGLTSLFNEALTLTSAIPGLALAGVVVGSGIEVVDLSTATKIKSLGAKPSVNQTGVAIGSSHGKVIAYVSTHYYRLERWDITDPTQPRQLPVVSLSFGCSGLALSGSHAYLACGSDGLVVLDGILP